MTRLLLSVVLCTLTTISAPIYAQLMIGSSQSNVSCNGANDGSITINPINGSGNYNYSWVPNVGSGPNLSGLGPGTYTLTLTDTISNGVSTTIYQQDFEGAHGWTLNVSTGVNDAYGNVFTVSDAEGGMPVGSCGVAFNGNKTLHVMANLIGSGATYNAGGLCFIGLCVATNLRSESPAFSTVGHSNIQLEFDYIANGDGLIDNASVWYNAGSGWNILTNSIKSNICGSGQGEWTKYSATLPAACNNNPSVKIAIQWTNNDDGIGTDPSVAIDNVLVFVTGNGTPVTQTASATFTITEPEPIVTNLVVDACDSYTFGGVPYTTSGNYTALYTSAAGCDSTVNLTLNIGTTPNPIITYINDLTLSAVGGTNYQWMDCTTGLPISGANSQIFTAPYNGSFAAIVSNGTQCSDTTSCLDVYKLSVETLSENHVKVFPNPVSEILYLQGVLNKQLRIIDLLGREILSLNSSQSDNSISVESLKKGVYLLEVKSLETGEVITTTKIIKN